MTAHEPETGHKNAGGGRPVSNQTGRRKGLSVGRR